MAKQKKKAPSKETFAPRHLPGIVPGMPIEPLKSEQTDPFGSYTGNAVTGEVPVQDADDL